MPNPFTPPTDAPVGPTASPEVGFDDVAALVTGMRFPQLLLGGLYGLMSLAIMGVGAIGFLGGLGAGESEQAVILVGSTVYLGMGALALLPAGLLVRSGLAALLAGSADGPEQREQIVTSLRAQLWFWRVLGLYLVLMTLFYGLAFFVLVGVGVMGNLNGPV